MVIMTTHSIADRSQWWVWTTQPLDQVANSSQVEVQLQLMMLSSLKMIFSPSLMMVGHLIF